MTDPSKISLLKSRLLNSHSVYINGSKSESNRALILGSLSGENIPIQNLSEARDTQTMSSLLSSKEKVLDVLDAGTTMRFLTAYLAVTNQNKILTGTRRMKERPIGILVDALRNLGARISYMEKEGYPPIEISGFPDQTSNRIQIRGDISSQYISALLMVAPILPKGIHLELTGTIGSRPYIQMTLELMAKYKISYQWEDNFIIIPNQKLVPAEITIEPDWSGASYWYSFVALAENDELNIVIPGLKENSFQGDSVISEIGRLLGVSTSFSPKGVILRKAGHLNQVEIDFSHCPDLAQTVSVICAAKNIHGIFTGLRSLRIKETDRIAALQNELAKLNARLQQTGEDEYQLIPSEELPAQITVSTYEDHRMAMAFAPLSMIMDTDILDPDVVEKSYPAFWSELRKAGIKVHN